MGIDWVELLDRALARRSTLVTVIENLNYRIQRRLQALNDVDDEISEYRKKIMLSHRQEAA